MSARASACATRVRAGSVVGQRQQQIALAAAQVAGGEAVDEHDQRAHGARGAAPDVGACRRRRRRSASGHLSSVPYGLAGSVAASTTACGVSGALAMRTQQIERGRHRELRAAEAGDEVAAADAPGVLHGPQHLVHGAEPAGDGFRRDGLARDQAVARQQLLRRRGAPFGVGGWRRRRPSRRATSGLPTLRGELRRERKRAGDGRRARGSSVSPQ